MNPAISELATGQLSRGELQVEFEFIVGVLKSLGEESVSVEVGWGASLPTGELWVPEHINLNDVVKRVQERELRGDFQLGTADLMLQCLGAESSVCFSHHGSVQVRTSENRLIQRMQAHWITCGFALHSRSDGEPWRLLTLDR